MHNDTRKWRTADYNLAGVIKTCLNQDPEHEYTANRVLLCFPKSDELYTVLNKFNSGLMVDARTLIENIKIIRSEMFAAKARNKCLS